MKDLNMKDIKVYVEYDQDFMDLKHKCAVFFKERKIPISQALAMLSELHTSLFESAYRFGDLLGYGPQASPTIYLDEKRETASSYSNNDQYMKGGSTGK